MAKVPIYCLAYKDTAENTRVIDWSLIKGEPLHPVTKAAGQPGILEEMRKKPDKDYNRAYWGHDGADLTKTHRAPIYAMLAGDVVNVETDHPSRGKLVEISNGRSFVRLQHLDSVTVRKGDKVTPDTQIGTQGSTGKSSGSHLHVSVYVDDRLKDPLWYITGDKPWPGADEYEKKKKAGRTMTIETQRVNLPTMGAGGKQVEVDVEFAGKYHLPPTVIPYPITSVTDETRAKVGVHQITETGCTIYAQRPDDEWDTVVQLLIVG
ncbi:MAG: M23 family metallopeptidase [Clostridiaceae bacterium]|nr:M23 family metallopeptidase [Clostridiaceae bacterium]